MESKVGIVPGPWRPLGLKPWIGAMDAPALGRLGVVRAMQPMKARGGNGAPSPYLQRTF
jgi:hypothetical protein